MKIGIIAEGKEDQLIIQNILKGLGILNSDVMFVRPDLSRSKTPITIAGITPTSPPSSIGTFQGVKNACNSQTDFDSFFAIADQKLMIIHLDTAELDNGANKYINRPIKNKSDLITYTKEVRELVIELINSWLSHNFKNNVAYAIAIEEIEAWILTLLKDTTDTCNSADPKKKLKSESKGKSAVQLSEQFTKNKNLEIYLKHNHSLKLFVEDFICKYIHLT